MNKVVLAFIIFLVGCSVPTNRVLKKLTNQERCQLVIENPKSYLGKSVNDLLKNLKINDYEGIYFRGEPPAKIQALVLSYKNFAILVFLKYPLKYSNPVNLDRDWDLELLKKEKIRDIKFRYYSEVSCIFDSTSN